VVITGAGTRKTRVIVERVRHLLETRPDLAPESLLVLTYKRQGRARAARADRGTHRRSKRRPGEHQQLPQLLPPGAERERRRCGHAAQPGCPRRGRSAAAPPGPAARPEPRLPQHHLAPAGVREVHQPRQGRARHAGRLRRLRRQGAADLRRPIRLLRRCRRPPAHQRQSQTGARRAQRVQQAPPQCSAPPRTSIPKDR